MANYKVTDSELSGIASAIRLKGGTSDPLVFPSGFISAISAIETQGTYVSKVITENGEYDPASDNADAFSHVTVSVPTGSTPVLVSKSISENGTYNPADDDADAYSQVVVNVTGGDGGSNDNFLIAIGAKSGAIIDNEATYIRSSAFAYRGKQSSNPFTGIEATLVSSIGSNAFSGCSQLSYASFPLCTYVDGYAFSGCSQLETIYFPICESVGYYAFSYCLNLKEVALPACTFISNTGFVDCQSISMAYLPVCESVGNQAFGRCYSLKTVNLSMCKTIASYAFENCRMLESFYLLWSSVVNLQNSNAFGGTPFLSSSYLGHFGSIFVPASLVDSYKSANQWSYYSDRITSYVE